MPFKNLKIATEKWMRRTFDLPTNFPAVVQTTGGGKAQYFEFAL